MERRLDETGAYYLRFWYLRVSLLTSKLFYLFVFFESFLVPFGEEGRNRLGRFHLSEDHILIFLRYHWVRLVKLPNLTVRAVEIY